MNDCCTRQRSLQLWSKLGPRGCYGQVLLELAKKNEGIVALSADLLTSSGLSPFQRHYPKRAFNVGIAEQNLIMVAAGLAEQGFVPFASSFAPFISARALDQIRMNLGYMGHPVKLVGLGSGVSLGLLGASHFGLEDVSIISLVPGMEIYSPACPFEILTCLQGVSETHRPAYIKLTGVPGFPVVKPNDSLNFLRGYRVCEFGSDITVVVSGSLLSDCLSAANALRGKLSVEVVSLFRPVPIPQELVDYLMMKNKPVVVVEEHFVGRGVGEMIRSALCDNDFDLSKVFHCAVEFRFLKGASYEALLASQRLDRESLSERIAQFASLHVR